MRFMNIRVTHFFICGYVNRVGTLLDALGPCRCIGGRATQARR